MYEARTHGSVRGMMLDMNIQHHPTRFFNTEKNRVYKRDKQSKYLKHRETEKQRKKDLMFRVFYPATSG